MTCEEFLKKGRRLKIEIEELEAARRAAFDLACKINPGRGSQQKGGRKNSTEERFIKSAEYTRRLDERIEELAQYREKMLDVISRIDNSVYRALLVGRFINCDSWEKIAEDLGYSEKWTRERLYILALEEAERAR